MKIKTSITAGMTSDQCIQALRENPASSKLLSKCIKLVQEEDSANYSKSWLGWLCK